MSKWGVSRGKVSRVYDSTKVLCCLLARDELDELGAVQIVACGSHGRHELCVTLRAKQCAR
jgi:hypothetical protein